MRRRIVLAITLPLVLVVLATPAFAQRPKRGGVIRIAEREAPGLDPHLSVSFLTHSHISLAYSQLVRFPNGPEQKHSADFSIVPDLAEKWTMSKDGKVHTFTLRKGVRFHNKAPVVAHPPYVKGFKHHDGYGLGLRLMYTWLDKKDA